MMKQLSTITAKIDPTLKADVEVIFKELNLSTNEAINLFFIHVKGCRSLPFDSEIPNEETKKALDEAEKGIDLIVCENEDDMFKKLGI
ncbi:type II toxin-antitoxin system RelB/DinJ family antitoxin [Desulfococcaceae bacterium HSG9]|nr:type II toxin-antitoxin system RelB/DinJ family antitoxin [Desulfococcaceae bacterium HSG9]